MFGLNATDSCKPYFIEHSILSLPSLFIYEIGVFVKTNPSLFSRLSDVIVRNRRENNDRLCIVRSSTTLKHNSVFCTAPIIFNKIPNSIKQLPITLFKKQLKIYLTNKCYYSLIEFLNEK